MKIKKILVTLIMLLIAFSNITFVFATAGLNPTTTHVSSFEKAVKVILGLFELVTAGVGIIMLIALGIKYMSAAPNDKAEIKRHAVVYIVGACMAFGANGIVKIIKVFAEESLK
ncbi:MAG: hypothetical protein HFJ44_02615 [Clostridia bacterium]|nr:hypothetical protein [Clostridia bacterium]